MRASLLVVLLGFLLAACGQGNSKQEAIAEYQRQKEDQARQQFSVFTRQHDLKILLTSTDRDVTAELWLIDKDDNNIHITCLLKSTSSRRITGGGSGTSNINVLRHGMTEYQASASGGGNTWKINDSSTRLPPPYGIRTQRSFRLPEKIIDPISIVISQRVYFEDKKDEGEVFRFEFKDILGSYDKTKNGT